MIEFLVVAVLTCYHAVEGQTDETPKETAFGLQITPRIEHSYSVVALPTGFMTRYEVGKGDSLVLRFKDATKNPVSSDGLFQCLVVEVQDKMNSRYDSVDIVDLLVPEGVMFKDEVAVYRASGMANIDTLCDGVWHKNYWK